MGTLSRSPPLGNSPTTGPTLFPMPGDVTVDKTGAQNLSVREG
jgi:hypothetical protein